jgi:serine/threonine protein kinase
MKLSPNDLFANRYQLIKKLGVGGFSEVWLAEDTKSDSMQVAVKIYASGTGLDTDGLSVFSKEYALVFNLNHPNLLKPMHYDEWEGKPYLVMQYLPNGSCLKNIGEFTEQQAAQLILQIGGALDYLHRQDPPIIHQDIKPDNILMDAQGKFLLSDFGISSKIRRTLSKSMGSRAGQSSGTTAYMAPERFSKKLEERAPIKANDVFSLGVTLFELLTGELPYGELGGMVANTGNEPAELPIHYSSGLRGLIALCINKKTYLRPTATEIIASANSYLESQAWIVPDKINQAASLSENDIADYNRLTKEINFETIIDRQTNKVKSDTFPGSEQSVTEIQKSHSILRKKSIIIYFVSLIVVGIAITSVFLYAIKNNHKKANLSENLKKADTTIHATKVDGPSESNYIENKKQRKISPGEEIYYTAVSKGNSAVKSENYEEAIEQYELAIHYKPGDHYAEQLLNKTKTLLNEQQRLQREEAKKKAINNGIAEINEIIGGIEIRFLSDHALLFINLQSKTGIMRSYHLNLAGKTYLIEQKMKLSVSGNTVMLTGESAYNIDKKKYVVFLMDEMYINCDDDGNVESIQMSGDENPTINPLDLESDYAKKLFNYFRWDNNIYTIAREKMISKIENGFE